MVGLSNSQGEPRGQENWDRSLGASSLNVINHILDLPLASQLRAYREMATHSLADAFLITQRNAAMKWIERSENVELKARFKELASSAFVATQAVSHISPSNRGQPSSVVMTPCADGFVVNGKASWVTGVKRSDYYTVGVELQDGLQSVALIPKSRHGVSTGEHPALDVLKESETGWVRLQDVFVCPEEILLQPDRNIVTHQNGRLMKPYPAPHTSSLALGHAIACLNAVKTQTSCSNMLRCLAKLERKVDEISQTIETLAPLSSGEVSSEPYEEVRASANAVSFQAGALLGMAARGHGLLTGAPSGKLVAESRFFLVWANSQRTEELTLQKIMADGGL
jgi:hypothetical protein